MDARSSSLPIAEAQANDAEVSSWEEDDSALDVDATPESNSSDVEDSKLAQLTDHQEDSLVTNQNERNDSQKAAAQNKVDERISALEAKLGVKLDDLAKQPESQPDSQTDKQSDSQEQVSVQLSAEEEAKFNTAFTKKFGVSVDEALQVVTELQQFKAYLAQAGGTEALAAYNVQRQEEMLQREWGVDKAEADQRLTAIRSYFSTLSPDKQRALDNPEGAQLIWAHLERDLGGQAAPAGIQKSSRLTTPGVRVTQPQKTHKLSDLLELSDEEYSRINWEEITPESLEVDTNYLRAF